MACNGTTTSTTKIAQKNEDDKSDNFLIPTFSTLLLGVRFPTFILQLLRFGSPTRKSARSLSALLLLKTTRTVPYFYELDPLLERLRAFFINTFTAKKTHSHLLLWVESPTRKSALFLSALLPLLRVRTVGAHTVYRFVGLSPAQSIAIL